MRRWVVLAALCLAPAAHAEPASQAAKLAELRAEVERLSSAVESEHETTRGDVRRIQLEKADLEARVRRQQARVQELDRMIAKQRALVQDDQVAGDVLAPVLYQAIDELRAQIHAGLPYRVAQRVEGVDQLETKLRAGSLTPQKATARLWQLYEDELRLTRENMMDRAEITLDGDDMLVDVARIGMVSMYFRTHDDRYGAAYPSAQGWTFRILGDGTSSAQVANLFDSLHKQVRIGFFELPSTLSEGT